MGKLIDIPIRLPTQAIEEISAIAKSAGVSPNTVARVMLAMYLRQNAPTPKTNEEERI